ncbi:MAG: ATP-binding protein [Alphaproteobacteria bacterium]|nr:ATP-binding protein [Alphaproteobacteria bacterium]MDP6815229.1 ATP-binding protein [Alphaproteobacteria bacterium]
MSHELRTPLQGILGMANLLQSNLDGRDLERARTIEGSGRVLLDLINNVFDVVRAKSDGESLSEDTFDLHGLLQETVLIMDLPGERPGRRLSLSIDPALPRWLHGDGDRIRRILYNLISNALKYGEGRPVSVTALRVGDGGGAGDCRVKIVVADQGPGIPAEDRQRIFEEFVRLHEGSTEQPGIGLGLSITSRLAKLLGGEVWVESEVGNGACFHFIVPLAAAAPREPTPATSPEAEGAPGLRVLLVEDLEINRQVAMGYLERAGHHVTPVETGGDAVAQAASGDFDVILMDIALPDISGIEATKAIRALPNGLRASVPIIALTANVFPDDQARYKAAGMNAILSKPLAPADLDNALAGATVEPEAEDRQPCLLDIEFLGNERAVLGDDVVSALVVEFRQQSEAILRELGDAARAKDMEAIGRLAHRLASLSGNFGLMDLLRHCQDTERVAGANDVQGATERVEALPAKFAAAIDALTAELSELQAAS